MLLLCNYYVTYRCNAFCEFCHFAEHSHFADVPHASLNDFKTNVTEMGKLGVKFIDLTGGEPLLNPLIDLMAEFAQSKKMQTSITTNALLYPKYAERLAGKVNLLHFSLDSPNEETHNKIRNVDCYGKVFESIKIAKSLGEFPDILFTVTNETYADIPQMHKIASDYDLMLIVNPVFSYFGNPGLSIEALEYIAEYAEGKPNVYFNGGFIKLHRNGGNDISNPSCKAVSRVIVISPKNEVILPCYHFEKKSIPITTNIKDLQRTEEYRNFKKMEGRFEFCQGCTVNCYFEPSFAFPTNLYSIASLTSKFKYGYYKFVKQKLKKNKTV